MYPTEGECLRYYSVFLLREIHRASECALQDPQRPIGSRGEANLVLPRGFQKVNPLIICAIVKINSRGECHGAAWRRIEEQCDAKARGRAFRTGLCKRHGSDSDPKAVPEERSPKGRSGEGSCDEHCGGEGRSGKADLIDAR